MPYKGTLPNSAYENILMQHSSVALFTLDIIPEKIQLLGIVWNGILDFLVF